MVKFDKEKAKKLYLSGKSTVEIGKELGVSYQTIVAYLKKEGIYKSRTKKTSSRGKKKSNTIKTCGLVMIQTGTDKSKKLSTTKSKPKKEEPAKVSREEKIEYCNKKYGKGNWHFMSKDEFVAYMLYEW